MSLEVLGENVNIGFDEKNLHHLDAVIESELDCLAIVSLASEVFTDHTTCL